VRLLVGLTKSVPGKFIDDTVEIEIEAEKLAEVTNYEMDSFGNRHEHRGITYSLFKSDGGFFVYVVAWSHWKGEPTIRHIIKIDEEDLLGDFIQLGIAAGLVEDDNVSL